MFDHHFFSSYKPAWSTDQTHQWVKIFSILVKISPSYLNFRKNLPAVWYCAESVSPAGWYCAESISPQYDIAQSQSKSTSISLNFCTVFKGTVSQKNNRKNESWKNIEKRDKFSFLLNSCRIKMFLTPRNMILRGASFSVLKFDHLSENIVTHWSRSVAQASWNYEKN